MANAIKDGFKIILKLSYSELTDEYNMPAFFLSRPEIRSHYAYTKTDEITDDLRLKYFKMPKPTTYPLDLNNGFEQYIFRRHLSQCSLLDEVIKYVLKPMEPLPSKRKLVLSHRGVLSRLMIIPYRLYGSEFNDRIFYATRYCGILHLIDPLEYQNETKNGTYHGKFEQICFSNDPDLDPITDVPVDRNMTSYGVFHSAVEKFELIYSAEISGVISDHKIADIHDLNEINKCKFIQTKLLWKTEHEDYFKHPKCLLFWAQLYLANTNDICIGIKDRDGVVRTPAQHIRVQDMPKNQKWKPVICIRFLNTMLTLIEETMSEVNSPYTVYEFKFDSFTKSIKLKIHAGKTNLSFLPEEFINRYKEQTNCN